MEEIYTTPYLISSTRPISTSNPNRQPKNGLTRSLLIAWAIFHMIFGIVASISFNNVEKIAILLVGISMVYVGVAFFLVLMISIASQPKMLSLGFYTKILGLILCLIGFVVAYLEDIPSTKWILIFLAGGIFLLEESMYIIVLGFYLKSFRQEMEHLENFPMN